MRHTKCIWKEVAQNPRMVFRAILTTNGFNFENYIRSLEPHGSINVARNKVTGNYVPRMNGHHYHGFKVTSSQRI